MLSLPRVPPVDSENPQIGGLGKGILKLMACSHGSSDPRAIEPPGCISTNSYRDVPVSRKGQRGPGKSQGRLEMTQAQHGATAFSVRGSHGAAQVDKSSLFSGVSACLWCVFIHPGSKLYVRTIRGHVRPHGREAGTKHVFQGHQFPPR